MSKSQNLDDLISRLEEKEREASIIYADEETEQMVIFRLDDYLLAFPGRSVFEIATLDQITRIPGLPSFFSGLVTLRGTVEAVINLKKILNIPFDSPVYGTRILFLRHDDHILGALADYVQDVIAVPKSNLHAPLQTLDEHKAEFVVGEFEYREQQVAFLNAQKVFQKITDLTKTGSL